MCAQDTCHLKNQESGSIYLFIFRIENLDTKYEKVTLSVIKKKKISWTLKSVKNLNV